MTLRTSLVDFWYSADSWRSLFLWGQLGGAFVEQPLQLCVGATKFGHRVAEHLGHLLIPSGHARNGTNPW